MGTHPIFESDFDCLTGRLRMWVEAVPGIAVMFGCFWIGRWGKVYAHDAGTHKGIFAGGGFTLPFTPSNSGTKKTATWYDQPLRIPGRKSHLRMNHANVP